MSAIDRFNRAWQRSGPIPRPEDVLGAPCSPELRALYVAARTAKDHYKVVLANILLGVDKPRSPGAFQEPGPRGPRAQAPPAAAKDLRLYSRMTTVKLMQLWELLRAGHSKPAIAGMLGVSLATVYIYARKRAASLALPQNEGETHAAGDSVGT